MVLTCLLLHICSFYHLAVPLYLKTSSVADELDSYMYQTVGHQAIDLYAEAMDLPLYRRTIQGSSLDTSKNYTKTDGDEVEDLYELLHLVKVGTVVLYGLLSLISLMSACLCFTECYCCTHISP